jgi:pilus assembly protein TadC
VASFLENLVIILIFVTIFAALYSLSDIKIVTNYHRERLLKIRHFGKSKLVNIIAGDKKLFTLKYFLGYFKWYKSHKERVKELIEKNHLNFKMNIEDYMAIKYLSVFSSVIALFVLLYTDTKDYINISDLFLTNINTIFLFFLFIVVVLVADIAFLSLIFTIKRNEIIEQLDFFTNLFELGIRSGETPIGALRTATEESHGFLKKEFEITLKEYDAGLPFRHALNNTSRRVSIDELTEFIEFIKRASNNQHDDFAKFINHSRQEFINIKMQISKDQQNTLPQRLTYYNMLGFIAELMIFITPLIFTFLDSVSISF